MADDVTKYSNRLERQRKRGLKYSLDAVDSLYANLSATQAGLARTLTSENNRTLSKLAAMASKIAAQSVRSVNTASSNMVGSYGALYGGQVAQKMDVAAANSEAVGAAGVAGLQTGKGLVKAGNSAMAIQQAGVADAQAAAQYALAQASIARAQADADAVAALKAQQAAQGISGYAGLEPAAKLAGNISKAVRYAIRELFDSGTEYNATEVIAKVQARLGIPPGDAAQMSLVQYIVQAIYTQELWNGTDASAPHSGGRAKEVQIILDAIAATYAQVISPKDLPKLQLVIEDYLKGIYVGKGNGAGGDNTGGGNTGDNSAPRTATDYWNSQPLTSRSGSYVGLDATMVDAIKNVGISASEQPSFNVGPSSSLDYFNAQYRGGITGAFGGLNTEQTSAISGGLSSINPTGEGSMPYKDNLAAGIELYILTHPGASKAEAEMVVKRNLASGGNVNYVEALAQYKS